MRVTIQGIRALRTGLMLATLLLAGHAQAMEQVVPVTFVVQGPSDTAVGDAVKKAFLGRHWTIVSEGSDELQAKLVSHEQVVIVKATWTASQVQIDYVSSENMKYTVEDGAPMISEYYSRWMGFIERDTPLFLARAAAEGH